MARNRGRRKSDHKIHDVVLWCESIWKDGVEEDQWVVYDSRQDKIYRFSEQRSALNALESLKTQDPNLNQL